MRATKAVRFGILGTARIAERVAPAIAAAPSAALLAVASRDQQRADAWSGKFHVPRAYGSYDQLIDDPDVDAVYIPLPPQLHHQWTLRAAEANKHILCEKPLAAAYRQAEEMAAACRQHQVQLMDGVMWLHHPRTDAMRRVIESGRLGQLRRLTAAFTFHRSFPPTDFRMQRHLGGGSLLDLGWYCVGAAVWAMGKGPQRVFATARYQSEVDVNLSALLWFDDQQMASFDCGFDTEMRRWMELAGTQGSIVCDDFPRPWKVDRPRFWLHDASGNAGEIVSEPVVQEVQMIENFSQSVLAGTLQQPWFERALVTQRVCEAINQAARNERIVELH